MPGRPLAVLDFAFHNASLRQSAPLRDPYLSHIYIVEKRVNNIVTFMRSADNRIKTAFDDFHWLKIALTAVTKLLTSRAVVNLTIESRTAARVVSTG